MEHYKNLDLADIKYFCDVDQVWKVEEWRDIPRFDNYQASTIGRIKSLKFGKEKILKQQIARGYPCVTLSNRGMLIPITVHKLVAIAFLNHTPCGFKLVVDHKDFNRLNNKLSNFQIITQTENIKRTSDPNYVYKPLRKMKRLKLKNK